MGTETPRRPPRRLNGNSRRRSVRVFVQLRPVPYGRIDPEIFPRL